MLWVRKTKQKDRRKIKFKSIIQICIWRFFFRKGKFPLVIHNLMQKILIKQIGKYYKKSRKYPEVVYQLKKKGKTSFEIVTEKCQNRFWRGRFNPGFWTVPPGMIYDENILMLYWWFAICFIYIMEFQDNLEF